VRGRKATTLGRQGRTIRITVPEVPVADDDEYHLSDDETERAATVVGPTRSSTTTRNRYQLFYVQSSVFDNLM